MKQIIVAVIYNSYFERNSKRDLIAEEDVFDSVDFVSSALIDLGYKCIKIGIGKDVSEFIAELAKNNFDVVFNLAEGAACVSEMRIAALLELFNIPFTGSSALLLGICLDKFKSKQLLRAQGILVPDAQVYFSAKDVLKKHKYPQIVKPLHEDASIGIDSNSVVYDHKSLLNRIDYIVENYKQPALVEVFIEGREFNISIYEDENKLVVLPIAELMYAKEIEPKICGFEAKWMIDSKEYIGTKVNNEPKLSARLKSRLEKVAVNSFKALGVRGYGRVDMRMSDKDKKIYVLEVNPNSCISSDTGFVRALKSANILFYDFINKMIQQAVNSKVKK